ncbi:hypothetical protein BAUCODRAFT_118880 [Baudoinia panamericana UAMH 10762]|uniref:Uncharacterized protein n=1 Tax=Baudoinia panamericana (strain UAMH 10762) TaxID=717646 RepID=M2MW20_BAUPA|nr:uncharacterized protein BAUCODRAFT_118880 [Baudoinia panamericana UAMH 10762]EMD01172.1 hypothetical protein BAUCODRAFT_118880 [Baudoinia panamericana UAMH 10762]
MSLWSDRRGMFQKGKEVHEPSVPSERRNSGGGIADAVRRASVSSANTLEKTVTGTTSNSSSDPSSPTSQRRRSSNTALFGNLTTHKRGSEDYSERRASHSDQNASGFVSGWYNSTFRGHVSGNKPTEATQKDPTRGVME